MIEAIGGVFSLLIPVALALALLTPNTLPIDPDSHGHGSTVISRTVNLVERSALGVPVQARGLQRERSSRPAGPG
jgi:hypothetical protein